MPPALSDDTISSLIVHPDRYHGRFIWQEVGCAET
jgi:hypothetical protein